MLLLVLIWDNSKCLVVVICYRVKLRHLLEWSSLYRVTLLLSKINDDSDLDAEAAILYGKVSNNCLSRTETEGHGTLSNITLFYGVAFNLINIKTVSFWRSCYHRIEIWPSHSSLIRSPLLGACNYPIFLSRRFHRPIYILVWIYLEFRSPQEPQWPIAITSTD